MRITSLLAAVCVLAVWATAAAATSRPGIDRVWVNGTVHTFTVTGPGSAHGATPLYVIAPVDPAHPLHPLATAKAKGFGAHDHVIADPHLSTVFKTSCDLTLIVPGTKAKPNVNVRWRLTLTPAGKKPLLYAADLGHGLVPLTSAARIADARKRGLATLVDTKILLACAINP